MDRGWTPRYTPRTGSIQLGGILRPAHLVVVLPVGEEADSVVDRVRDVFSAIRATADEVSMIAVVDESSADGSADALRSLASALPPLSVHASRLVGQRGVTSLAAYRAGLDLVPDVLLHVDGCVDAAELPALVRALADAEVAHGVRRSRDDPWFRRAATWSLARYVRFVTNERVSDPNTPLRAYRGEVLRQLLSGTPARSSVPHVHFSVAERRLGLRVARVPIRSAWCENDTAESIDSTIWPSRRFVGSTARAAREILAEVGHGSP